MDHPIAGALEKLLLDRRDNPGAESWIARVDGHLKSRPITSCDLALVAAAAHQAIAEIPASVVRGSFESSSRPGKLARKELTFIRRLLITGRDVLILTSASEDLWSVWSEVWLISRYLGLLIDGMELTTTERANAIRFAARLEVDALPPLPHLVTTERFLERWARFQALAFDHLGSLEIGTFHAARKDLRRFVSLFSLLTVIGLGGEEVRELAQLGIALNRSLGAHKDVLEAKPFNPTDY